MTYANATRLTPVMPVDSTAGGTPSALVAADGTNGNKAELPLGRSLIHVKNTGVLTTVTVDTPGTVDGNAISDHTFTVPATTGDVYFPILRGSYHQPGTQDVFFTWSQVTGITVEVIVLPNP